MVMKKFICKIIINWVEYIMIPVLIIGIMTTLYFGKIKSEETIAECEKQGGEWVGKSHMCIAKGAIIFRK